MPAEPVRRAPTVWSRSARELRDAQHALAAAEPPLWQPPAVALAVGACAVCFPRGESGPGARGDAAWAAAAVLRGRRALADAVAVGETGAEYAAGLLALLAHR